MPDIIKTTDANLTLRFATKKDVPIILDFIKQLAEYEELSHEVTTNISTLENSLFGERRVAEVIIGDYKNEPAAFALFFHNFSTFLGKQGLYVEDLYVKPDMRGKGIGRIMLTFLAHLAVERGCERLEWWVLDWNERAISFYKKLGAQPMDNWTVFRISGQTLSGLAKEYTE